MKLKILIVTGILVMSSLNVVNAGARGNYGDPPDYHQKERQVRHTRMNDNMQDDLCLTCCSEYRYNDPLYGNKKMEKRNRQHVEGE